MDTELLRTFLEVRNTRHFGRAASNLFITQAAVSARIKQLEETLGVTLFVRHRNNIQLSTEGERLIPHAENVLQALARARHEVAHEEALGRRLKLGIYGRIWLEPLQQKFLELQASEPELALWVESRESFGLIEQLLDRTLDLAIVCEPPGLPELESCHIGDLTLRLYSSHTGLAAEHVLKDDYVYLDWGDDFTRFHSRHFGEQRLPRLGTNFTALARDVLMAQGGSCFLPSSLQNRLADAGLLAVPGAPEFYRPLNMTYNSGSLQLELIEAATACFVGVKI